MNEGPIDAVIPLGPNDRGLVDFSARSIRRFVDGVRMIWIVSREDPGLPDTVFVPEDRFPFRIADVQAALGTTMRAGWYLQQLIKLYVPQAIPESLDRYLVTDADTLFLRRCRFVEGGRPVFNFGTEFHAPYFEHMARVHPGLRKLFTYSGITHCMLFDRHWVAQLIATVEAHHQGKPFWRIFLEAVDPIHVERSGASEYEMYFNFCLQTHPGDILIKQLRWTNTGTVEGVRPDLHDYVSLHWYGRAERLDRKALAQKVFGPG
ncbi:DUF6492 family protein [Azospirillum sp.]|uniref:DUF6492 family protein n=1 Tax=Azospirillum sp. TaxID=34012 RepID=UPI00263159EB|nr:DUF6492 family protein [Azospirillum sp.]